MMLQDSQEAHNSQQREDQGSGMSSLIILGKQQKQVCEHSGNLRLLACTGMIRSSCLAETLFNNARSDEGHLPSSENGISLGVSRDDASPGRSLQQDLQSAIVETVEF